MTNEATQTDHSAAGHSCAHCDSAEDHHALDEKGIVDSFRSAVKASGIARIVIAVALVASAAVWAPFGILAGALAWAAATGAGILAVSASGRKYGSANAVILGTVASAAITPLAALATATWVGGSLEVALAGVSGWFLAVAIVEFLRDRKLSAVLIADSRDGEAARQGVLFGEPVSPWVGLAWSMFTAALFGVWVWVTGLLALAVIPLVPLQVVFALRSRRRKK